jgi:phosphatidylglycerophosphatase A
LKNKDYRSFDFNAKKFSRGLRVSSSINWYTILVTWFYTGKFPIAPGTVGSIASFPLFYYITQHYENVFEIICMFWYFSFALIILGTMAISRFQKETFTFDHPSVVIDEVAGMMLTFAICFKPLYKLSTLIYSKALWFVEPLTLCFLIGLVVFRFYDIYKPLIIGYVDKNIRYPIGVMLDDVLAEDFAGLTITFIWELISKIANG